jgi:hypothetical protein
MSIRLLCVSTADNTDQILEALVESSDDIDLRLHFGNDMADFKASSLSRMDTRKGQRGHLMRGQHYAGDNYELLSSPIFRQSMERTVDQLYRYSDGYRYRSHNLKNLQDYLDYFYILSDMLAQKIKEENITHALFFNVPHLVCDTLLYDICKCLGIKTVVLTQSIFPGKYFSMEAVEDFGFLDGKKSTAKPMLIDQKENLDLFYMKDIGQAPDEGGKLSMRGWANILAYILLKKPSMLLQPFHFFRLIKRARKIYAGFPSWRDPFSRFFHENEMAYFEHLMEFENQQIDIEQRFIYFPLQLQPEMTTSSLGGRFRDQLLAIEELSRILPDDVKIYVKENPKQGAYLRGPLFFHRLKRIPNVVFMPSFANTNTLIAHCEGVATITGTVGWEAVRKGKNAIVFGSTWYSSFPGVFRWSDTFKYSTFEKYKIDHSELEKAAGALLAACHDGVVERHYVKIDEGHDVDLNISTVCKTLKALLSEKKLPVFRS